MGAHNGAAHHKAKLTDDKVRQIRQWRAEGATYDEILERLDWLINSSTLWCAIHRRTWRHVT